MSPYFGTIYLLANFEKPWCLYAKSLYFILSIRLIWQLDFSLTLPEPQFLKYLKRMEKGGFPKISLGTHQPGQDMVRSSGGTTETPDFPTWGPVPREVGCEARRRGGSRGLPSPSPPSPTLHTGGQPLPSGQGRAGGPRFSHASPHFSH